jgi:hypothetical protein
MKRRAVAGGGARKGWLVGLVGLLAVCAVAGGVWHYREQLAAAERAERRSAERRAQRLEAREQRLRDESERLIPSIIRGVYLGMPREAAMRAREMTLDLSGQNEEGTSVYEERLPTGSRVMYIFDRGNDRLERIQVLSLIPAQMIGAHLLAMNEEYGSPTGVWDCPNTGGVPTRRFTWRFGETAVSDVFFIREEQASVTLYIAPSGVIERSLRRSACRPVRDREQLDVFPVSPTLPPPTNAQP